MTLHRLSTAPVPELSKTLAEFEKQFTYPLGPGRTFRISHGEDYSRFFRAMGELGISIVLEERGQVLGTVGVSVRRLLKPDGDEERVIYLGDLKVAPEARTSIAFLRLAWEAERWSRPFSARGFGVVMDGTPVTPDAYTGCAGIPGAIALGSVMVWRVPCLSTESSQKESVFQSTRTQVISCFRELSRGRYASVDGKPEERSQMTPQWLLHPGGRACGLVEDTRKAKRLWTDEGSELRSGHLSYFAFSNVDAAVELLQEARQRVARAGHPALFVAVAPHDHPELAKALNEPDTVLAPATIYGGGLDDGAAWNINTSEI
jgi:hypothetical protein